MRNSGGIISLERVQNEKRKIGSQNSKPSLIIPDPVFA